MNGLTAGERWTHRMLISTVVVVVSALMLPALLILKVAEGFWFSGRVLVDGIKQAWNTPSRK